MTKRIVFALTLILGVSGGAVATAAFTAQPAAACTPHTS